METKEEIEMASKYFSKIEGMRIGKFMSELKYQYIMRLNELGFTPHQIKRITKISHDKQHYYRTTYCSDTTCSEDIKSNMFKWMEEGLYPFSHYRSPGKKLVGYILGDNPKQKPKVEKKALYRTNIEFDRLLDQLGL
jgi:hypothetical protein